MFLLAYMRQMIFIVSFFAFSSGQNKNLFMPFAKGKILADIVMFFGGREISQKAVKKSKRMLAPKPCRLLLGPSWRRII